MVDARLSGKGERFFFATATEADTKADQLRIGRKNEGDEGARMPATLRADAVEAERLLAANTKRQIFRYAPVRAGSMKAAFASR